MRHLGQVPVGVFLYRSILSLVGVCLLAILSSCNILSEVTREDEQTLTKASLSPFVSELYGEVTKSIVLDHSVASRISWMGFIRSNDYKFFRITKVNVGASTFIQEGMTLDGQPFIPSPTGSIKNIVVPEAGVNGKVAVSISYRPLRAIEAQDKPHDTYLIIYYDQPKVSSIRIKISGLTKGIKNEKCARPIETMTPVTYAFVNKSFDFYFCGSRVAEENQDNISNLSPDDPDYHGINTNLTPISAVDINGTEQFLTFYRADETTVCLLSEDLTGTVSSIPNFIFPIPEGLAPIDELNVKLASGSFAECTIGEDGSFFCDENVQVDTALVPISPLSITNGEFTAPEMVTTDCPDFGSISGSGEFGASELELVLKGTVLSDNTTQAYEIVDNLVSGKIRLKCVEGC